MTRWEKWLKDNNLTRAELICQKTDCYDCPFHTCKKTKAYDVDIEKYLDEEVEEAE